MDYRSIDRIPDKGRRISRTTNNQIQALIQEIYDSGIEIAEIFFDKDEYSSGISLHSSVVKAIAALDLPMKAYVIRNRVYVERRS